MTKKEVVKAMNDAVLVRISDWRCAQAYLIQKVLNDGSCCGGPTSQLMARPYRLTKPRTLLGANWKSCSWTFSSQIKIFMEGHLLSIDDLFY